VSERFSILHKELRDLYRSPTVVSIMKYKGLRWAGHVARVGKTRNAYRILVWKALGKIQLKDREGDGRIT